MEGRGWLTRTAVWCLAVTISAAEVLTPPYFNLAERRRITATATCGEGVADPELYCKLVGANADGGADVELIQGGQWCDRCDPRQPNKMHPAEYAIDGSKHWWQSPPLSRGMNYNKINLTIDLGQLFQVAYVLIKMGNSPRPGVWVLERSVDNGQTYSPWQYFADSQGDCEYYFGKESLRSITEDDDVVCVTQFSKVVPLESGEIVVSLLNNRPSANSFFNSSVLQEFTRATNVRLRLLRTKTLLGHLMSVARRDPTVTRRYFYAIKDISIGGRCVCNGHADVCDIIDPNDKYKLHCRCQHNTCGSRCESCCSGFIQKKWRPAGYQEFFECEPCNCHGHSLECVYDEEIDLARLSIDVYGNFEGGGRCLNCQHNTEGINCDQCVSGYFRPFDRELNDTYVCQPCDCNYHYYTGNCEEGSGQCECQPEFLPPNCDACNEGYYDFPNCKPCDCHRQSTEDGVCQVGGGQCPCKENYQGLNCDRCAPNYYNFPECLPCNCSRVGSEDDFCDIESGQCQCQNQFGGRSCDRCKHGFFNYPDCTFCNCDNQGTNEEVCDKETGRCLCQQGYDGDRCDSNAPGWWSYPYAQTCGCHQRGSSSDTCNASGRCACLDGYSGRVCDQCSPGHFNFPECSPCNCDASGSIGISCDDSGRCQCKNNFSGTRCDQCREGFYIFPHCEECNCDPAGVLETFGGCGEAPAGELCQCKQRVTGRICNRCRPLFWNLRPENPQGCEECGCHPPGTLGGLSTCDTVTGQCQCKSAVASRRCDRCRDGTFNLREDNLFGCSDCGCNAGGSVDNVCDKASGQCRCRPRITGLQCDQPLQLHYFPTLYQLKLEAEDGHTPYNTAVRFGYNEAVFPGYSWRGYAVFSDIQREIIQEVYIEKPSIYRMVVSYHNPASKTIVGRIRITPDDPADSEQEVEVHFTATSGPRLMTVEAVPGNFPVPLVMNPGQWSVSFENNQNLFLDYFVLLPLAYYEGTILTKNTSTPCLVRDGGADLCLHYAYPDVFQYDYIYGSAGYRSSGDQRQTVELYQDFEVLELLKTEPMAYLNHNQALVQYDMRLRKPGRYVLLLNYFTPEPTTTTNVLLETSTRKGREKGRAILYNCPFSTVCRQVVTDMRGRVGSFHFDSNYISLDIQGETNTNIAIDSIIAVPYDQWHQDLVRPQRVCTRENGDCVQTFYLTPAETTKVEFEDNLAGKFAATLPEGLSNVTKLVYLNHSDPVVDITGKLRRAGQYVFVVHYFQPLYPEFDVDVLIQNGQFYEGNLPVHHCPSTSGCRALITHAGGNYVFDIQENFVLSLKEPNHKSLWVDYVLVVPVTQYTESVLHELPVDRTSRFINLCGHNNFNLHTNDTGFCREAAFEVTTDYNSGAVPCQCDFHGSLSFECESFGGQCPCLPNIIGRRCNRCKTGFYGFPECRPCACPSTALCDPITGECICPPRVVGERCDRCAVYTYGFDPIIGCEECQCSPLGVRAGNVQCDQQTGHCDCKGSVMGRRCGRCSAGYWSFPFCQLCNCDLRGTEANICSQDDASCFCKVNVQGRSCDSCRPGSYNLEETNPDGCTKCFCFGKSEYCSAADINWAQVLPDDMSGWRTVVAEQEQHHQQHPALTFSTPATAPNHYQALITQDLEGAQSYYPEGQVFFAAPDEYLGNRVTSYGGYLRYTLVFVRDNEGSEVVGLDVLLTGSNIIAQYYSSFDPESSEPFNNQVKLTEHNFRTVSGLSLEREQFMMLLHRLDGIYIRANYWSMSLEARLSNVSLDIPTSGWAGGYSQAALSIELCQCPINYKGSSCEECADGYYRAERGPYGGYCIPCQCNGHSETCDPYTGKCLSCQHNTVGDHCELCSPGYHGLAIKGTPYDCLICACPLPSITNNFGESCDFLDDGFSIRCDCRVGYSGDRCERCASSYYGQPEVLGDRCRPCQCNDNIDPYDLSGCDDITGRCLNCLNNTYGESCERCALGYYGDAIAMKNCERCTCDECGTRNCQHFSGDCECFDNVVGNSCDRCAQNHWGFASCQGCQPCQCALAAYSSQCDEGTGQCDCTEGVTGQRCDQCKPGFWNYTRNGCQECSCREGFSVGVGCNPRTGQCQCLPGVVGANCDHCPYRWMLIDGYGCQQCEECVHALLDTTDQLAELIHPTIQEFESAKYSYFLHQRLGVINSTMVGLRPRVELLDFSEEEALPLEEPLQNLLKEAQRMATQTELVGDRASQASDDGFGVHVTALKVQKDVDAAFTLARRIIAQINKLVIRLETGTGAQLELSINEAEAIVAEMIDRDFTLYNDKAEVEHELARELKESLLNFYYPIKNQQNTSDNHKARLEAFAANLEEMRGHINKAQQQTAEAQQMIRDNRQIGYQSMINKLNRIEMLESQADDSLREAEDLVDKARGNYVNLTSNFDILSTESERLRAGNSTLSEVVRTQRRELQEAQELARDIPSHAQRLKTTAAELDDLLADTREVAENALSAANAYKNIVLAIDDAYNASLSANMTAARAVGMSVGVSDQALESQDESEEKQQLAISRVQQVEQDLRPQLENAQEDVRNLRNMNDHVDNTLSIIDRDLTAVEQESFSEEAERMKENAISSQSEADAAILQINNAQDRINVANVEAKLLVKNLADSNRNILQANEQVTRVEQVVPEMTETAIRLEEQKEVIQVKGIDVGERLKRLRNHIKQTRELSSKIRVGVSFQPSTTIELENPTDITKAATATKVSLFARTEDPNGLLLFLGTPTGGHQRMRRTTTDDFLALELDGGYVRLTINLGAGPHSIEYNRLFVADGEWTKIVVDRIGKVVRLSVERENMETQPIEEVLPGRRSVFNLDPKVTKIFVGGIPAGVEVDRAVVSTSYLGDMEDLRINDQPLGLWNFMQNGTNENRNRGAMARDRLVDLVPPTGLRFGGEGYAALNTTGYRFRRQFDLQMDFKTFAEDGILFIITGGPSQYMAVALEEGRLIFQYNLGSGLASMMSDGTYHDGQWHHIEVARQETRGVLKIGPGLETLSGASGGRGRRLNPVSDTMYFGGFPGEHEFQEVTNEDFHGCIDKVVVSSRPIDLSTSKATQGTVPGCPIQVANMVSFERSSPGYVRFGSPEGSGLQLVFKFKTDQPDGLILYASTRNQDSYLSLSLAEGALILRAAPGGELTTGSYDKYNDTEWHVVIASREDNELRLDIDDFKSYKVRVGEQAIPFDGPVFFGGVPEVFKISAAASATDTNFFGCLGDATLNGRIVNFAQTEDMVGAHLQKCPLQRVTSIFFEQSRANLTGGYPDQPIIAELPEIVEAESDYHDSTTTIPPPIPFYTTTPATTSTITTTLSTTPTTEESYPDTMDYPLDSCALPEVPEREIVDPAQGFRFGSKRSSRLELHSLPGNARADFKFSFELRTIANDSLIFYAASPSHRDYVTFYIKDGKIVFSFNPGTGKALMRTSESFNDDQWHSVIVERRGEDGVLMVDGYLKANATASGDSRFIDIQPPFFYGGIAMPNADMVRPNTEGTELSFNGCLRNLRMNNQRMAGQHQAFSVLPCSENVEPGVFFGVGDRAHVILLKRFSVGRVFEMSMEIKPRKNSGVITSVHGRRDFVLLQMKNGTLILSVDNGKGISTVVYKPPSPWSFCDGQWHYIKLIKNKNIALMVVDDITTSPATGKIGATSTDTRNPLFLGSQPFVTRRRGDATHEKYVGCIRNVYVNKAKRDLPFATFAGNVDAGSCPTI